MNVCEGERQRTPEQDEQERQRTCEEKAEEWPFGRDEQDTHRMAG